MLGINDFVDGWPLLLVGAAGSSAVLTFVLVLALCHARESSDGSSAPRILPLLGAGSAAALVFALGAGIVLRERSAEADALVARADRLANAAINPGSPLGCLQSVTGDTMAAACEKAVFASPVEVASGLAYVAAQFALLREMNGLSEGSARMTDVLPRLRRSLEADPFGFLAHVLVVREGCIKDRCPALAALRDASRVRTNLRAQTFEHYVDKYRETWGKPEEPRVAGTFEPPPAATEPDGHRKVSVNIDFPSAASIPPIDIMTPEPKAPAAPPAAKQGGKRSGQAAGAPAAAAPTDPVWTPQ